MYHLKKIFLLNLYALLLLVISFNPIAEQLDISFSVASSAFTFTSNLFTSEFLNKSSYPTTLQFLLYIACLAKKNIQNLHPNYIP